MERMRDHLDDDAFIDALARGEDPSGGADPLAGLLLTLKDEVDQPMPPAPVIAQEEPAGVASLDAARAKRYRTNPWLAGLVGAAAASVAIIGTGSMIFDPQPEKNETTMVELATTLDELEAANEKGDEEAARGLLEQARLLVTSMNSGGEKTGARSGEPLIVTKTVTASKAPAPAPAAPTGQQGDGAKAPAAPAAPAAPTKVEGTQPQLPKSQQSAPAPQPSQAPHAPLPAPEQTPHQNPAAPAAPAVPAEQPAQNAQPAPATPQAEVLPQTNP